MKKNDNNNDIHFILLPICLFCKNIIQLQSIEITIANNVYLKYKCSCKSAKLINFDKYYYGLSILSNIEHEKLFEAFCISCNKEIRDPSLSGHKTHLLSPINIKNFVKQCSLHNKPLDYVCLKCNIDICFQCTKENHKGHNCISMAKYYANIKNDFIEKYKYTINVLIIKRLIKEKQKCKVLIDTLNLIYTFFINSCKALSKRPHYNLCFSLTNLQQFTYSNIPYKIKYKQNKILGNIGYGIRKFKVLEKILKTEKKEHTYCYYNAIMLNDNYILIHVKLTKGTYLPFIKEVEEEISLFLILDPELKKDIYQYYIPDVQKISHLKDNLYCVCGIHFFYIWDSTNIANNFPKTIYKYDVEYICAVDAVLLNDDTLIVLRPIGFTKINLKEKDEKYPSFNYEEDNCIISQIFHLQNNDIILVDEKQFKIFDVSAIEALIKKSHIKFNEIGNSEYDENKSDESYQCFYSNLSPKKILICSLYKQSDFPDSLIVGYDLNDNCNVKFKVSNIGEIYNKFLFVRDDLCIGAGQNEFIWLFDPDNGETYLYYQKYEHYCNLTTITNLKYGYYLSIQKDKEFNLLYGGIE